MFAVIFEVQPRPEAWDDYLRQAALLRPELLAIDGFVSNERFRSQSREGWLVSISIWRDEKALVLWRTHGLHHLAQSKGRASIFADYHLRVGEIVFDTRLDVPPRQRLDPTRSSDLRIVTLVDCGLREAPPMPVPDGDVFESLTRPDAALALRAWRDSTEARAGIAGMAGEHRIVEIIRDYGMFARLEAPQYFPA